MRTIPLLLLACACAPDATPTWGTESVWIGEDAEGQLAGFHSWSIYGPGFERQGKPRHFICTLVYELTVEADDSCEACTSSWRVAEQISDTDCDGVVLPAELDLTGIGVGPLADELLGEEPYPLAEAGSYTRFGDTAWQPHGWAFPGAATQEPVPAFSFDGEMSGWPAWSYALEP